MRRRIRHIVLLCYLLGIMPVFLSGCFLRLLFGAVGQRDTGFGIVFIAHIGGSFGPMAICDLDQETGTTNECDYSFFDIEADQPFVTTSTAELLNNFGVLGLLIDPVIIQVPAAAKNAVGTIDDGFGPRPIAITEAGSFMAQPGTEVRPEAGHKFLILDLPPELLDALIRSGELPGPFDFDLEFEVPTLEPLNVKAMYTGKVVSNGQTFYPPLLPCSTDFASVPPIRVPVFDRPALILPQLVFALRRNPELGCRGQVYDFRGGVTSASRVFIPWTQQ